MRGIDWSLWNLSTEWKLREFERERRDVAAHAATSPKAALVAFAMQWNIEEARERLGGAS